MNILSRGYLYCSINTRKSTRIGNGHNGKCKIVKPATKEVKRETTNRN